MDYAAHRGKLSVPLIDTDKSFALEGVTHLLGRRLKG